MKARYGESWSRYGPGVVIELTDEELATAVIAYLAAHQVHISGPLTVTVNGELCQQAEVFVDPSGEAMVKGIRFSGRGPNATQQETVISQ